MTGGRPRRPALEARLVREAVADVDPSAPREPLARDLARKVVAELAVETEVEADPIVLALTTIRRQAFPSPAHALATDPDVDTLSLFVERRVARLRSRAGRDLNRHADEDERQRILLEVEHILKRRYLRHLRG